MPSKGTKVDTVIAGSLKKRGKKRGKTLIYAGEPFTEMYFDGSDVARQRKKRTVRLVLVTQARSNDHHHPQFAIELQYLDHSKWFPLIAVDWSKITMARLAAVSRLFREDAVGALLAEAELL
jgi:hypothetical protein